MYRTIVVSLAVLGLLAVAGCRTEKHDLLHSGCHKIGVHRAGRSGNGITHHHHEKPAAAVEVKAK